MQIRAIHSLAKEDKHFASSLLECALVGWLVGSPVLWGHTQSRYDAKLLLHLFGSGGISDKLLLHFFFTRASRDTDRDPFHWMFSSVWQYGMESFGISRGISGNYDLSEHVSRISPESFEVTGVCLKLMHCSKWWSLKFPGKDLRFLCGLVECLRRKLFSKDN